MQHTCSCETSALQLRLGGSVASHLPAAVAVVARDSRVVSCSHDARWAREQLGGFFRWPSSASEPSGQAQVPSHDRGPHHPPGPRVASSNSQRQWLVRCHGQPSAPQLRVAAGGAWQVAPFVVVTTMPSETERIAAVETASADAAAGGAAERAAPASTAKTAEPVAAARWRRHRRWHRPGRNDRSRDARVQLLRRAFGPRLWRGAADHLPRSASGGTNPSSAIRIHSPSSTGWRWEFGRGESVSE